MRRLSLSALVLLIPLLLLALPAHAEVEWCKSDPVIRLNGTLVQIWVAIPAEYQALVDGPVEFEIRTPKGVVRELVSTDDGFNGYGEVVRFGDLKGVVENGTFPTEVRVRVPIDWSQLESDKPIPVQVEVIPENAGAVVVRGTSDLTRVTLPVSGRN